MSNTDTTLRVITILPATVREHFALYPEFDEVDHIVLAVAGPSVIHHELCGADEEPLPNQTLSGEPFASLFEAAIEGANKQNAPAGFIGGLWIF